MNQVFALRAITESVQSPKRRLSPVRAATFLLSMMTVFALGCAPASPAPKTPARPGTPPGSGPYAIAIVLNDKQVALVSPADLSKLPQVKVKVEKDEEQGPTLLSVLQSVGINEFSEVTITGFTKGRVASAELTLKRSEVNDKTILAIVTRGTVKLTGPDIGAQKSIIDVTKVAAR